MPAPTPSPTRHPLRSVDLMRNRDIGPSWRATKKPRPKPMTAAFIVEYSSFSSDHSRQVEQATWSDSLPEDQCARQPAVRLERVVGHLSRQRESEPRMQTSRATIAHHLDEDLAEQRTCRGRRAQIGDLDIGHDTESARTRTGCARRAGLDDPRRDRLLDPRDDVVEHLVQGRRGLEAEHALRLLHGRNPSLDVVLERWVAHVPEGHVLALDAVPDLLCQREHGRGLAGGKIEVVVQRGGTLHRRHDSLGEVARICVMPDLRPTAEDVQGILSLDDLLHPVGNDVTHGELDVAAQDLDVAERTSLTDSNAVEGADDRVREGVLAVRGSGEILDGELLKTVRGFRRWDLEFLALRRWPRRRRLEHHR